MWNWAALLVLVLGLASSLAQDPYDWLSTLTDQQQKQASLRAQQQQQQQPSRLLDAAFPVRPNGGPQEKAAPEFVVEPAGLIHYLNSSDLIIPCSASGNPAPVISWLHRGAQLEAGSLLDKRYVRYDNSLVISAFKAHQFEPDIHSTTYQCLASNAFGSILSRDVVINGVIDQDYEASVADQFVTQDNDALFKCQLPGQARHLLQVLGWLEDGQPLAPAWSTPEPVAQGSHLWTGASSAAASQLLARRTLALPDGRLYVGHTRTEDANKAYRCQVRNLLNGRLQVNSISGRLFVTEPDEQAGTSARLVDFPKPLTVSRLGEQLLLSCLAQGTPRPHIRWFRAQPTTGPSAATLDNSINSGQQQGETVATTTTTGTQWREVGANESTLSASNRMILGHDSNVLLISPVQAQDDRSRFRCVANNTYGSQQAETEVRLELWPPSKQLELEPRRLFMERSPRINHHEPLAQVMALNCSIRSTGWPLIELEWLRNGRSLFSVSTSNNNLSILDDLDQELNVIDYQESLLQLASEPDESVSSSGEPLLTSDQELERHLRLISSNTHPNEGHLSRAVQRSRLMAGERRTSVRVAGGAGVPARIHQAIKWMWRDAILYQLIIERPGLRDQGAYQCRARTARSTIQATAHLMLKDQAPQFISTFQEALVEGNQGQQASLRCIASGSPLPELSWSLSGFPVPESGRIRVGDFVTRDGLIVSYVNISNIQSEDGGLYECQANNEAGHLRHAAYLNVTGPPQVRPMGNQSAIAGASLSVQCPAGGWPIDQISWSHNSSRLPVNHRQRVFPNGTLVISDLNEVADSGLYTCQARAADQLALSHLQLSIRVPPVIEPFSFAKSLSRGQRYNIMCTVIRGDLPVSMRWFKDEQPLFVGGSQVDSSGALVEPSGGANPQVKQVGPYSSTLSFDPIQSRHRGLYTCEATNEAGSANQSSSLVIHVPPEWRLEPKDQSVTVGRTAIINCQADAFPPARIEWRLSQDFEREPPTEFKPIISSVYMRVFENGSLIIYNTQRTDAGHYLCQASNGVNPTLSRVIKLTVHVAAHFKSKIRTELVRRGQPARLRCEALGDPPIEINWLRNKEPMWSAGATEEPPRYSLRRTQLPDGLVSELSISQCDRADSGLFTCLTQNQYGNDDTSVQLIVQGPPDAPQDIRILDYEARSVHISWTAPDSGNSPLLSYVLSYAEIGDTSSTPRATLQWTNISVPSNDTSVTLQGLSPLTEYQFQLVAVNAIGSTKATQELIKFRTDDEAPTGPPVSLRAIALSSRSISVRWLAPERRANYGVPIGFYVGYKLIRSTNFPNESTTATAAGGGSSSSSSSSSSKKNTFIYKTVELVQTSDWLNHGSNLSHGRTSHSPEQECILTDLKRGQKYAITVQAWNGRGAGPASEPIYVDTWKIDVPPPPSLKMITRTTHSIQLTWQPHRNSADKSLSNLPRTRLATTAPVAGKVSNQVDTNVNNNEDAEDDTDEDEEQVNEEPPIISYLLIRRQMTANGKPSDQSPIETKLPPEHVSHLVEKLQCGTSYQFTIVAQNSVGFSPPSEPLSVKTEGTAPVAPDKNSLLLPNTSSVAINLASWHNGACQMRYFELMYRPVRLKKWTSLGQVKAREVAHESSANLVGAGGGQIASRSLIYSPQQPAGPIESSNNSSGSTLDTVLLEDLSAMLTYELKIIAVNEAGSTEALYTFSARSPTPDQAWPASNDFKIVSGHLAELLSGDNGPMISWLVVTVSTAVLILGTCVAIARRRGSPSSSSCSLSVSSASRSNQSSSCYYTDNAGVRRTNPPDGYGGGCSTGGLAQEQQLGEETPMLASQVNGANHLDIYAPFQNNKQIPQRQQNESTYACPVEQRHPISPHSVELSSMINGSEAEIYLGASALTMARNGAQQQQQQQLNGIATQEFPKQIRPEQSTFISQPANKLNLLTGTMNRSSTLPTNCQEQLIQRLIQQQQQQQQPQVVPAATPPQHCDSFPGAQMDTDLNGMRITSLLESQLQHQQQVYATVKRTCPRQARLCDYSIYQCSNGIPLNHQTQFQTLHGCCGGGSGGTMVPINDQVTTCYNQPMDQHQLQLQQQQPSPPSMSQLQQQPLNSDYQQLRPVN